MEFTQITSRLKILSYHNTVVPSTIANSLNIVWTSIDLSNIAEVHFYANKGPEQFDFKSIYGTNIFDKPSLFPKITIFRHKGLAGLEKRLRILKDIIMLRDCNILIYTRQAKSVKYFLFLKKIGFKIKIMLEIHSEKEQWNNNIFKQVDGMIFASESLKNCLTQKYSIPHKIPKKVLYYRIRKPLLNVPNTKTNKDYYSIGYIGGFEFWKGVDTIIDAMEFLPPNAKALFIGGKDDDTNRLRLISRANKLGVLNKIQFKGYIPYSNLGKFINEIDFFILPLLDCREGSIPLKLFDYICLGKPIVAANQESINEILKEGDSALFFTPGSGKELAEKVITLIENPLLSDALSLNVRKLAEFFTVNKWLEEIKSFLEIILNN